MPFSCLYPSLSCSLSRKEENKSITKKTHTRNHLHPQQQQKKLSAPFAQIYYSSQFSPLVVFFLIYLCVVRNKKFHHFVRFHAMQATMLDIVGMIFQILRGYFTETVLMSPVIDFYDTIAYSLCLLYCIYYALT